MFSLFEYINQNTSLNTVVFNINPEIFSNMVRSGKKKNTQMKNLSNLITHLHKKKKSRESHEKSVRL